MMNSKKHFANYCRFSFLGHSMNKNTLFHWIRLALTTLFISGLNNCCTGPDSAISNPLRSVVNLSIGESQKVGLVNGDTVQIKLIDVKEIHDELRDAVREAQVKVSIDGQEATIISGNYYLPQKVGSVRIDCPVTGGYVKNVRIDDYGFEKDARIRIWPVRFTLHHSRYICISRKTEMVCRSHTDGE